MDPEKSRERGKVLVAGVGNILRGDDGFGVAVVERLLTRGSLPSGVDVIETGIGGMSIVQQLMDGYRALIVVDAVDRGEKPGTVFVLEPEAPDLSELPASRWQEEFFSLHLIEPSRVFALARALGVLPVRTAVVGCQPIDCDVLRETLSPPVESAVDVAVQRVERLARAWLEDVA